MGRFLLKLCYDGTNYHGWQVQANAVTVQATVQDALQSVLQTRPGLTGCSRTDSGVHAAEFCCHFDYEGKVPCEKIADALNARLPRDIGVLSCCKVPDDFHARYSVISKQYVYRLYESRYRSPFFDRFALRYPGKLSMDVMREAAAHFLGRHDFSGFCSAGSSVEDTVRTVLSLDITRHTPFFEISVEADGFLYNMVRILTGTLLAVSEGSLLPSDVPAILESRDRKKAGITAPARGLCLTRVRYPEHLLSGEVR